jgi:hypothetical protein
MSSVFITGPAFPALPALALTPPAGGPLLLLRLART